MTKTYKPLIFLITCFLGGNIFAQCKPSIFLPFNGSAKDTSGNARHGTVVGATLTSDRYGLPNRAYRFDGVNDHIVIADDTINDLTKAWTIMAWIKPDSGYGSFKDNHVSIVEKWGNAGPGLAAYGMSIHDNGALEGFTHTGSSGTYKWSNGTITPLVWTHVAVTRSNDDSVRLYINGVLDRTYWAVLPQNSTFAMHIGMAADPSIQAAYPTKYRYKGVIDNVIVYKCALTPSQFLGVEDMTNFRHSFRVFPNPSTGILNIEQNFAVNYEVKIFDVSGKMILSALNATQIDLSNTSGLFTMQITDLDKGTIVSRKIIIE